MHSETKEERAEWLISALKPELALGYLDDITIGEDDRPVLSDFHRYREQGSLAGIST